MAMQTRDSDSDSDSNIKTDPTDTGHARPMTFRERHALKVMGAIMAVLFALVVAVQVGC